MALLSKSKIIAFRQCPKRMWLELHRKELLVTPPQTEARFRVGHEVGAIAKRIYDPKGLGTEVFAQRDGFERAFSQTAELLASPTAPVFEAGFKAGGALAFADVMVPLGGKRSKGWRMIEVKSSTSVKDYHLEDIAVQTHVARAAGCNVKSVSLATIDSSWVYPGDDDYVGLLKENDLTKEAMGRANDVRNWIAEAQKVASSAMEPMVETGDHCYDPFECGFCQYCHRNQPKPDFPLDWLPKLSAAKRASIEAEGIDDLRQVPDAMLSETQLRVKRATTKKTAYFNSAGSAKDLSIHQFPAYFLDFETIQQSVPIWQGTRPYQQIPFQFSLHIIRHDRKLSETSFLDLTGTDPSERFSQALIKACGTDGPIFVYNAAFESSRIRELAARFPKYSAPLQAILERIVDLLPVARQHYYHPAQQGSWSIKAVLPAAIPELSYEALDGVKDGDMAMAAYAEAINPVTPAERREKIRSELLKYCQLDTYAMVRLWQMLSGRSDLKL